MSARLVQLLQHEKNKVGLPHGEHNENAPALPGVACLAFSENRVEALVTYEYELEG